MSNAPIGIMDSGSGGLSIWNDIVYALPQESTIYIGDHRNLPYGGKPMRVICNRALRLIQFLVSRRVKAVVVACNTATIAGVDVYRQKFPHVPIIGVVPVIKTAAQQTKTGHVAVLSTAFTARSSYQKTLIQKFASHCVVTCLGCSKLVPLIEQGVIRGNVIEKELRRVLRRIDVHQVDVVALGCTHFPFVRDVIRSLLGDTVKLLDSSGAVTRHVKRILTANDALANQPVGTYHFYTTGFAKSVQSVATRLLGRSVQFRHVLL